MALTKKRRVFIEEYLRCWNGAEAARRAGYKFPRNQAAYLLTIPTISDEIERRISELTMQADEVLVRLAEQARGLDSGFFTLGGELDALAIARADKTHLIKKTKQTKYGLEVELYDAQTALEKIGRALGIFKDRLDVTTGDEPLAIPDHFEVALKRAYGRTGRISDNGGKGELPGGSDQELPAG